MVMLLAIGIAIPGDFEQQMPDIAKWFLENPPKNART
jgi:hypothetical protein